MGITSTDIAKAAEAINRYPSLTATARRVALELLNSVKRDTGLAWPSEARMAEALGVNVRTIRRGKAELRKLGLVTWIRRGTSRKGRTPLYALAWDKLLNIAVVIKAKVKAAREAARNRFRTAPSSAASPVSKPQNNGPRPTVDRTSFAAYLSQNLKLSSRGGFWKAPGTPQGQILTDQQLDARASTRFYTALQQLGVNVMAQLIARPDAAELEAKAIKAERYRPGTGLDMLKASLLSGAAT